MYISVKNAKDILHHFLILSGKYGWVNLVLTVDTGSGTNKIFQQVEKIQIAYMHHQAHVYFWLIGIENVGNKVFPKPLIV